MRAPASLLAVVVAAAAGALLGVEPAVGIGVAAVAAIGAAVVAGVSADRAAYIAVSLVVLVMNWNGIRFAGGAIADAFMVAAFAAVAAVVIVERRPVLIPRWMLIAGSGLVVAAVLTIVFPPSIRLARSTPLLFAQQVSVPTIIPNRSDLSALFKFEVAWLLLPLMITVAATTRRRCRRLLDLFVLSAAVSAAVAVVNFASGATASGVTSDQRALGLTLHSNYLAFNSVVALPLALLWFARGPRWKAAGVIAISTLLGAVYASGSRAGSVSAVVAVLLTMVAVRELRPSLRVVVPLAGMLLTAIVLFTRIGQHILAQVRLNPGNSTALASNNQRSLILDIAFEQIRSRPLQGVGFAVIQDAQNLYLQLLAAGGVIALTSFAVYIGGLARTARWAFRGAQRSEAIAAAVSISVWLLHGFFDAPLIDKYLYVIPGVLLAMSHVAVRSAAVQEDIPADHLVRRSPIGDERKARPPVALPVAR